MSMTTARMYELSRSVSAPGLRKYYEDQILLRASINHPDSKQYAAKIKARRDKQAKK